MHRQTDNKMKRKFNPAWPSAQADSPERNQKAMRAGRQRRNKMAQTLGYPNAGALLSAIEQAGAEVRQQIAKLLTTSCADAEIRTRIQDDPDYQSIVGLVERSELEQYGI
jgi:hypothetical protein